MDWVLTEQDEMIIGKVRGVFRSASHGLREKGLLVDIAKSNNVDAQDLTNKIMRVIINIENRLDADLKTIAYLDHHLHE